MPLGVQPFELPINSAKRETSIHDKILIRSHGDDGEYYYYDRVIDRRIHTKSIKVKFFVVGYRRVDQSYIDYIGRWVELEPHQLDFWRPTQLKPFTYFLGFYPYVNQTNNDLHVRLQLHSYPDNTRKSEIYIEKLTVIDSDFNSNLSWLTDTEIDKIEPPITGPEEPEFPFGIDPDPNCKWIF
jgi:hypothetical protein